MFNSMPNDACIVPVIHGTGRTGRQAVCVRFSTNQREAIINLLPSKGTCLIQLRKHYN